MKTNDRDDDKTARDGETVRVPIMLMDAEQRSIAAVRIVQDATPKTAAPGQRSLPLTDADRARREAAIVADKQRVSNAWRNPPAVAPQPPAQHTRPAARPPVQMHDRTPLYDAYDKAIEQRWKGATA